MATNENHAAGCEEYPGKHCSASECLAASKFLRELIAELDIKEAQKSAWWRMIWGFSEARRHYALAAQHAEDLARERKPNNGGQSRREAAYSAPLGSPSSSEGKA